MANIHLRPEIGLGEQLRLMQEDTRFDVADDRDTDTRCLPDLSLFADIRSRPPSRTIPKMGVANRCIFNCAYCINRASNEERPKYCFDPKELARLSVEAAQKNHHGVFITSAIHKNADYTEELIIETLKYMRQDLQYKGYIHAKIMPGADPMLIETAGLYADRLSVNIEVAKSEGYDRIAKQKNKQNILTPMGQISDFIQAAKWDKRRFATSQTTQLMAGSTGETDRTIMTLSKALYQKYRLKRVYYTAFQYRHPAKGYDLPLVSTPKWRTRRLYQADRLIQLYGFSPDEVTPEEQPDLPNDLDPKTDWAIRNWHLFPVEINRADYEMLLRIPGIGIVYAKKILRARQLGIVTFDILEHLGIPLRKCMYFIVCNGKYWGNAYFDRPDLLRHRLSAAEFVTPCEQMTFAQFAEDGF